MHRQERPSVGSSAAARGSLEQFGFDLQIERLEGPCLLFMPAKKFAGIDLHPRNVSNAEVGRSLRRSSASSPNSRMRPPDQPPALQSFVDLYQTKDRRTHTQYHFECGSIRLTNALMAELFHVSVPTIKDHLKGLIDQGLIDQGQIDAGATIRSFRTVRTDGSRHVAREVEHDSLLGGSRRGSEWQRHAFEAAPAGTTATPA